MKWTLREQISLFCGIPPGSGISLLVLPCPWISCVHLPQTKRVAFARWLEVNCAETLGPNPAAAPPKTDPFAPAYFPDRYRDGVLSDYYRYAALGLETLFAKDIELMNVMLASRSQPERMGEVKDRINAFHPALFSSLMTIRRQHVCGDHTRDQQITINRENNAQFRRGLGMVLGATGSRWEQLPDLSDAAAEQVRARVQEYERGAGRAAGG